MIKFMKVNMLQNVSACRIKCENVEKRLVTTYL